MMGADLYLKTMLTIIAACLVWMCVNGVTPGVLAQTKPAEPMRVMIVDERNVPLSTVEGLHVSLGLRTVPVSIANPPVAVRMTAVDRGAQPIAVRVLREPPTLMPQP